jgi:hypothetical protein
MLPPFHSFYAVIHVPVRLSYKPNASGQLIAQLLSYPAGRLWERFVPRWTVLGRQLNPGEFTIKVCALFQCALQ